MNERLGIVEELAARREKYARFQYRAPAFGDVKKLQAKIERLEANAIKLNKENVRLTVENRELHQEIKALMERWGSHKEIQRKFPIVEPTEVKRVFIAALARHGYRIPERPHGTLNGIPYSMEHLLSRRHSPAYAAPRHVAMWLCRRICITSSLTMLGKVFGRDHTSIMHGCVQATKVLAKDATLDSVANEVLALFEVKAGARP